MAMAFSGAAGRTPGRDFDVPGKDALAIERNAP
jgi:hypothetical protein